LTYSDESFSPEGKLRIRELDDAEVDHIDHCCGGKTSPEKTRDSQIANAIARGAGHKLKES
jgi:hypothetical protein